MRTLSISLALALSLLLAACGGQSPVAPGAAAPTAPPATAAPDAAPTAPPDATAAPTQSTGALQTPYPAPAAEPAYPGPATPDPSTSEGAQAELEQEARARLARQLGVDPATLTLQRAERQDWPDSSLGCPAPGTTYMQVIMPGFKLEFSDGARSYAVHTTLLGLPGEPMVYCDERGPVELAGATAGPGLDAAGQAMVQKAIDDLAQQLQIEPSEITVGQAQAVEWNDSSLGCPRPDGNYLQVITPGYRIELLAEGQLYRYHTDSRTVVVRCEQP